MSPRCTMCMPLRQHLARRTLAPDRQRTRATTHLTSVAGTGHITSAFIELGRVDLGPTETLAGVLGAGDREAAGVAEGDAGVVGHGWAVEVAPLGEGAWRHGVGEAAGVGPAGIVGGGGWRWSGGLRGGGGSCSDGLE